MKTFFFVISSKHLLKSRRLQVQTMRRKTYNTWNCWLTAPAPTASNHKGASAANQDISFGKTLQKTRYLVSSVTSCGSAGAKTFPHDGVVEPWSRKHKQLFPHRDGLV